MAVGGVLGYRQPRRWLPAGTAAMADRSAVLPGERILHVALCPYTRRHAFPALGPTRILNARFLGVLLLREVMRSPEDTMLSGLAGCGVAAVGYAPMRACVCAGRSLCWKWSLEVWGGEV